MTNLNEQEKKLLRQQAEAYAFIYDLRETALMLGQQWVIQRTNGIEERIARRRKEYPRLFQLYLSKALVRARGAQVKDGKRKTVPRRETPPPKEKAKEKAPKGHKRDKLQ